MGRFISNERQLLLFYVLTGLATAIDGTAVTANQEINTIDLDNLVFTPNADFNGNVSFTWNASDGTALATADAKVDIPSVANYP